MHLADAEDGAAGVLDCLPAGLLLRRLFHRVACRVPPRRAGGFHLVGQMKVTKAKALNAKPFMGSARCGGPAQRATWRYRGRSAHRRTRRGLAARRPSRELALRGRGPVGPRRPGRCKSAVSRCHQVARWAGRARREERTERCCIQPLCFGDFHLRPQMKVTRPPGRDPASSAVRQTDKYKTHPQPMAATGRSHTTTAGR